ncbi:HET-domain-containing protein, partial [Massarina eburnea CBS 473.64]
MVKKWAKPSIGETQIDINTLRIWTQQCRLEHTECRSGWQGLIRNSESKRSYTLRLVDCSLMRVVSVKSHVRYAALSYVWGDAQQYSSQKQDIIYPAGAPEAEYVSLENRKLPRTIEDAIQVCRDISIRFLWVDTLCIIQDDISEKSHSLSAMDRIYKSAILTIVTASGTHADAGIPGIRPGSRNTQACEGWLDGLRLRRVNVYDSDAMIENTPWSKRGWTYQESYFSPRKLIFANDRAYYHC